MSHYSVCVAIPKEELRGKKCNGVLLESILDRILEPYCERTNVEKYLKFFDETQEAQKNYQKETITVIRYPDGSIHGCYDAEFSKRFIVCDGKILEKINDGSHKGIETDRSRKLELVHDYPVKAVYSFRRFCEDICGYAEHEGRWGYWSNPDAKWDWYAVGGRFSGEFLVDRKLKDSLIVNTDCDDERFRYADGARKGDIQWEERMKKAADAAEKDFERYKKAFETGSTEGFGPVTAITEDGLKSWGSMLYQKGETLQEFLRRKGIDPDERYLLNCFAFVDKAGIWHSCGNMHWFGMISNQKDEIRWHKEVRSIINELDDEDFLVMVDCHI